MLKKLSLLLAVLLCVSFSSAAYADLGEGFDNMRVKLSRGIVNTLTGWVEIPSQINKGYNQGFRGDEKHKVAGVATGAVEGALAAAGRTISGVADIVGFWALSPASNEGVGIPLEAEKAWEKGEIYDLTSPTFQEATIDPIGKKLIRGLGNTLFGIAEIPGQIKKGVREGSPDLGILKGLWCFLSREISGLYDLATVCLPTPGDAIGSNFDKEWPWDNLCAKVK